MFKIKALTTTSLIRKVDAYPHIVPVSLESRSKHLEGDSKAKIIDLLQSMLRWVPEERKAQENFSSIPSYQRTATEKHDYMEIFPTFFLPHTFAIGGPNIGMQKQRGIYPQESDRFAIQQALNT